MQSKIQEFFNESLDYNVSSIEDTNVRQNAENQHVTTMWYLTTTGHKEFRRNFQCYMWKKTLVSNQ